MRSLMLDVDGPVHVADHGGSGRPMLLIHGLGGHHANWLSVAPGLASRFRVYAVDLPGFGRSPAQGRKHTIAANVDIVGRVLEAIAAEPAVLAGNSMGGLISLGVAAQHAKAVAALVLVDPALPSPNRLALNRVTAAFLLAYAAPWLGRRRLRRSMSKHGPERVVRETLQLCTVDINRIKPEVIRAHVEEERARQQMEGWDEPFFAAASSIVSTLAVKSRVEAWIRRITAPTLLLHGRCDRLVSYRAARATAALRPDWEYVELDDVGHVPMLEVPERFLDITGEWLQRTVQPGIAADARASA